MYCRSIGVNVIFADLCRYALRTCRAKVSGATTSRRLNERQKRDAFEKSHMAAAQVTGRRMLTRSDKGDFRILSLSLHTAADIPSPNSKQSNVQSVSVSMWQTDCWSNDGFSGPDNADDADNRSKDMNGTRRLVHARK
jgi:hypothetical protein